MAPVPLKGNSFFREQRGAVLAVWYFHLFFRAYRGKRALTSLAASQHFLPELLTIT